MGFSKATITFNTDVSLTETVNVFVRGAIDEDYTWTWVLSRSGAFEVTKGTPTGTPGAADALTFKTAFDLDAASGGEFTSVVTDNEIVLTSTLENVTFFKVTGSADISVVIENALETTSFINVNSPYFLTAPIYTGTQLIDPLKVDFNIKVWTGDLVTDKPADYSYTYTKYPLFLGQRDIYISIDKQIRDYIQQKYSGTLDAQSVFIEYDNTTTYNDGSEQTTNETNKLIGLDGYGSFKDGVHPTSNDILINNTHISVLSGNNINIPFYMGNDDYTIESRNGTTILNTYNITAIEVTDTVNAVSYLSVDSVGVNNIRIVNDETLSEVILSVEIVDECTYTPVKCVFLNAKGVKQEFYFFKSNKESAKFKDESYKRSTLTSSIIDNAVVVSYDTNEHNNKSYNKQGSKSIDVNSGYIDQDNNVLIEELLMSEYVWLTVDSVIYPVDVDTKSVEYLTRLNDQLIKYAIKFNYSFDIKQNIR